MAELGGGVRERILCLFDVDGTLTPARQVPGLHAGRETPCARPLPRAGQGRGIVLVSGRALRGFLVGKQARARCQGLNDALTLGGGLQKKNK